MHKKTLGGGGVQSASPGQIGLIEINCNINIEKYSSDEIKLNLKLHVHVK